jgi:hypothetical protein
MKNKMKNILSLLPLLLMVTTAAAGRSEILF